MVAALPLWLPWVLQPVAQRFGLTYENYKRLGYAGFKLENTAFTNETIRFQAARIESAMPTALLWNRWRGGSELIVEDWSLVIAKKDSPRQPSTNTPPAIVGKLQQTADRLSDWIERAALTNGVLMFQQHTTAVPWLVWQPPSLDARLIANAPKVGELPLNLALTIGDVPDVSAQIAIPKFELRSHIEAVRRGETLTVTATNLWSTNEIFASATLRGEMIPVSATLSAPALHVSATNLPLRGYGALEGSIAGEWTNGTFTVNAHVDAAPVRTNLPPLFAKFSARGDTNSVTVEVFELTSRATRGDLSRPVQFSYSGELLSGPARLAITGDLSRLPLSDVSGAFRGIVDLQPSTNTYPHADVALTLDALRASGIEVSNATVRSELRWPVLRLLELNASLASGLEVKATGVANLTNRVLSNAMVRMQRRLPTNIVPASLHYSNVAVTAEASGPITNLTHHATATIISAQFGPLGPLQLQVVERGEHFRIAEFRATATAPRGALQVTGSGEWHPTNSTASLATLNYWRGGTNEAPLYALTSPVEFSFTRAANNSRIQITPLLFTGEERKISAQADLEWPHSGTVSLSGGGLRTGDFTNLLTTNWPVAATVAELEARAHWSNGPVLFALSTTAELFSTSAPPVEVIVTATNTAEAIHVTELTACIELPGEPRHPGSQSSRLIGGDALLPLSVLGTSNGFSFQVHSNAPMRLKLHTSTNDALETLLAEFAKVRALAPKAQVSLDGTLAHPQGTARVSAHEMSSLATTNDAFPRVTNVRADFAFERDSLRLQEFRASVAGQPLFATAEIPAANAGDWKSRLQLDKARGQLRMESAELAAFAQLATNVLAPRGTLDVNLALQPGMQLSGHIRITNAATAPLASIGPVHDINAEIRLRDRAAVIESMEAHAGGAPLSITGLVNFAEWQPGTNRWPNVRLRIAGTNLALLRESQKIIRTDLDLQITNVSRGTPGIGGTIDLRDSLFLANLASLVPSGVTKPSQRPPYFSIENDLLAAWPLNVEVQGERFLTVRTPVFRGEVSANLDLRGVLAEPVAIGQVRIASGRITFPFATLTVKQGFVTLGSANPYSPELFITAAGRAYDYDIRLEVTGDAQEPILEFTSVPPLTSEQILLMVASGQIPRSDFTLSTGQRAQKLGMFVGKNLLSELGLGGDGENLTIRSGEGISERGRSTYSVEYKLTEDVSLVGEYDRFDEYNAGIQWRVFSK